jgi:TRAP transporter TAXI family solute receptor
MKRRTFCGLTLSTLSLAIASCKTSRFIRIGAGNPGGAFFVFAGAISTLLESAGMSPRVQTTGGGAQNAILLDMGELDIAIMNNIDAAQALYEDHRLNVRSIMPIFNGTHHFVVNADEPIYTLSDLEQQPFGLGNRGSTHDVAAKQIFEILNISPRIQNAGKGDTNNMVRDGLLSGFFATSAVPMPAILELQTSLSLRLLEFSDEEYLRVQNRAPWLIKDSISPVYNGLEGPVKSFSSWSALMANKNVEDQVIYDILSACYSGASSIKRAHQSADINPNLISILVAPLHPGAESYYRDQGLVIPDNLVS